MNEIFKALKDKILVLDGAMGTMIQRHHLTEEDYRGERFKDWPTPVQGNNDLLSITQPEIIRDIHLEYLKAGADIIETNTFSATTIAMADYQMESIVDDLNTASVHCALEAIELYRKEFKCDKPLFIAGSMGPTNKTASMSPDVNDPGYRAITFEDLRKAYYQQAKALWNAGANILLVETIFDTLNAKAALFAIQELAEENKTQIPIMVSGTITDASGRTLSGQTAEAFWISLNHLPLLSIGFNCALGAKQLTPHIEVLSKNAKTAVSAHPNAGLPNAFGEYEQGPTEMVTELREYFNKNLVNIIGGCCGTTPQHIKAIAEEAKKHRPRRFEA